MAGYPASGKSTALWKTARTGFPLFGADGAGAVPGVASLNGTYEDAAPSAKLQSGLWVTLTDIPELNRQLTLPARLILHLDLLLAFLLDRPAANELLDTARIKAIFARLFDQPALRRYERCTVTTLHASLGEIRRRWSDRYPAGISADRNKLLLAKDRLISDDRLAAPTFALIHAAWGLFLETLDCEGKLAQRINLQSGSSSQPQPRTPPAAPHMRA